MLDVATLIQLREAARPQVVEHASLAFGRVVRELQSRRGCRILDLGAPNEANITFYSQFARKFHFEDLSAALSEETRPSCESLLSSLRDTQPFDLILCWDTLNYLSRPELQALACGLAERIHPGTHLHAFLAAQSSIPRVPGHYRILTSEKLRYEPCSSSMQVNPHHSKADLERYFQPFVRSRSYLLRHGVEECLFLPAKEASVVTPPATYQEAG